MIGVPGTGASARMTIGEQEGQPQAVAVSGPAGRDALGHVCFWTHFAVFGFVLTGWIYPFVPSLVFYLLFLPAMFFQWRLNRSTCVLNNLESLMRTGRWRNPGNREEGAWLKTLVGDTLGIHLTRQQMDRVINSAMLLLWLLALGHLMFWYAPGLALTSR